MGKSVTDMFVDTFECVRLQKRLYLHSMHNICFYTITNEAVRSTYEQKYENFPYYVQERMSREMQNLLDADNARMDFFTKMKCKLYIDPCSFQSAYRYLFSHSTIGPYELIKWTNGNDTFFMNKKYIFDKNLDKIAELHFNDTVVIVDKKCIGSTNAIHKTIVNNIIPAFISVYGGDVLFKDMQLAPRHSYRYIDNERLGEMLNKKLKYLSNTSCF